jgi:Glyoxalase-like domain
MTIRWLTIFLDFPAESFGDGVTFWREVTGSGLSAARGADRQFATLLPTDSDACLRVQRIRDGSGGCHLDLHIDADAEPLAGAAARAVGLGARVRHREDDLLFTLDSPGGFTFCLVRWEGEEKVPAAVRLDRGGVSRADQLCLDIPPQAFGAECAFWTALTGWELRRGKLPEFAHLPRPAGIPARLLFQRRQRAAAGDRVAGHVDFACTDRAGLAQRHAASGAQVRSVFPGWVAMSDPAGHSYCLTARDPLA